MLVWAVSAHTQFQTTQVTLKAPYGGPTDVSAVVNKSAGEGSGLSYTTVSGNSTAPGTALFATGATQVGTFTQFNGTSGTFQSAAIVETFAIQGTTIAPVGGANFSVSIQKGVFDIYAVPTNTFNSHNTATWGPNTAGSILLYSGTLTTGTTTKGTNGDQGFGGQPATGQNVIV
jgi:hypothetical protein